MPPYRSAPLVINRSMGIWRRWLLEYEFISKAENFKAAPHNGARRFGQCFDTSESMENAGILDVFPIFHTARLGKKIRRSPLSPPSGVALIVTGILWLFTAILFGRILPEGIALPINLLLFGVWFLFHMRGWRCPYCLRHLGRFQFPTIQCPHCRKEIPKK